MLYPKQIAICGSLAVAFWVLATLFIRLMPVGITDTVQGDIGFITSIPVCWLCIWLTCRVAKLAPDQILAGCMIVIADAMLIDGIALRWFHTIYTTDERTGRLGAAWLLWGYGISAWIAILVASRKTKSAGSRSAMPPREQEGLPI